MNYKDYYGKTPIFNHDSFWNGDVRLLIDLGAEIHAAQDDGTTPFHLAALYGRVEAVKALLEAGADVNVKSGRLDWPGYLTPMVKTLLQDRLPYSLLLEICQILLDHGATITGRCQEYLGKSAQRFQRVKRGITDPDFLCGQMEGLDRLYQFLVWSLRHKLGQRFSKDAESHSSVFLSGQSVKRGRYCPGRSDYPFFGKQSG